MRSFLDTAPGEPRLLAMAFAVCAAGFVAGLGDIPAAARAATQELGSYQEAYTAVLIGRTFASFFLAPLLLYALAALARLAARVLRGKGTFFTARAALFRALYLMIPAVLAEALLRRAFSHYQIEISPYGGLALLAIFAGLWSAHLAEVEGFSRVRLVFAVVCAIYLSVFMIIAGF